MAKRRATRVSDLFDRFSEPLLRARESIQPEPVRVERIESMPHPDRRVQDHVSWPLQVAAAWSWRMVIVVFALGLIAYGLSYVTVIAIPVALALLLAVLLDPVNRLFYRKLGLPKAASATLSLLIGVGVVAGLISLSSSQIISQFGDLVSRATDGFTRLTEWLKTGPLPIESEAVDKYLNSLNDEIINAVQHNSQRLASGALSITITVGNVFTGTLIALFVLFFLLKDGRKIWIWFLRCMPQPARVPLHEAAVRGWTTLGSYAKAQILVAAIDATGIGLGAYFLGVPLAIPLAVLVFLGSFIPIVGAFFTGTIAVLVALVDQGFMTAVFMLIVILVVQQVEGNVLQPWLMSNAVSLHPVAVLLAVAAGSLLFGIAGALFAVPVLAFLNTSILYLYGYDKFPNLATDNERAGGPPGSLEEQILTSYAPNMRRVNPEAEPTETVDEDEASETKPSEVVSGATQDGLEEAPAESSDAPSE
ncbi:AI-2E family transporter [uncultured Actinomyces sp.]|uniref:AI-2E family transporter n=1 Tax=uncultured Actinomyces sp. TaxID=249061 RepID=UPI00260D37EE|nr:AI-2E family transporter [uncultured Actinomyces sp.]